MYINEASKKSGTTKKAIEYYCQKGLLDPAVSDKGYRIFSDEDVEKLKKISLLRFPGNISNKQIEIRDHGRRKKYYDPLAWIDEIEKWDALFF